MHDNNPALLEEEKHRNLTQTQHKTSTPHAHAPGWNEYLASSSEAFIKADRSGGSPSELQRQTIEHVSSRHTPDEQVSRRESPYDRDEVAGPLSTSKGRDELQDQTVKEITEEREEISGPLSGAEGKEADGSAKHVRRTFKRKEVHTNSEDYVKADRGEH